MSSRYPQWVFCPNCGHAAPKEAQERVVVDVTCPRCGVSRLADFYAPGSHTHKIKYTRYLERTGVEECWSQVGVQSTRIPIIPPIAYHENPRNRRRTSHKDDPPAKADR